MMAPPTINAMKSMNDTLERIHQILASIHQGLGPFLTTYMGEFKEQKKTIEVCTESLSTFKDNLNSTQETNANLLERNAQLQRNLHDIKVEEFAYKRKKTMSKLWHAKLNFLSQKYAAMLMNEKKSAIYETWAIKELFLPKKFRCHKNDMNEDQRAAATKLGFENMRKEITDMKERAINSCKKVEETNEFMLNYLKEREMPNVAVKMSSIWEKEVKCRKEKAEIDWKKDQDWLEDLPNKDEDVDEEKPKEMNQQKTKGARKQSKSTNTTELTYAEAISGKVTKLPNGQSTKPREPTNKEFNEQNTSNVNENINQQTRSHQSSNQQRDPGKCRNCGETRHNSMRDCPAKGRRCAHCKKTGHFTGICLNNPPRRQQQPSHNIRKQPTNKQHFTQPLHQTGPSQQYWQQQTTVPSLFQSTSLPPNQPLPITHVNQLHPEIYPPPPPRPQQYSISHQYPPPPPPYPTKAPEQQIGFPTPLSQQQIQPPHFPEVQHFSQTRSRMCQADGNFLG